MESIPRGRSLVPASEISRPAEKWPPWSAILSAMDPNHCPQAAMISCVGGTNPYVRIINFFIVLSFRVWFFPARVDELNLAMFCNIPWLGLCVLLNQHAFCVSQIQVYMLKKESGSGLFTHVWK